jgi:hypothetical protein
MASIVENQLQQLGECYCIVSRIAQYGERPTFSRERLCMRLWRDNSGIEKNNYQQKRAEDIKYWFLSHDIIPSNILIMITTFFEMSQ